MPCYPAMALLLACSLTLEQSRTVRIGTRVLSSIAAAAAILIFVILFLVRGEPTPGDISDALSRHPSAYTLSLGHMEDLTLASFAYLRLPLVVAGLAFLIGTLGTMRANGRRAILAAAVMMVLFFQAARLALVVFDPYMSSRQLAEALMRSPHGRLIVDHHYYTFSSVFFYTDRRALLRNGRINNLVYGSYAPHAPDVFLSDEQFKQLWQEQGRDYIIAEQSALAGLEKLVGANRLHRVASSGGKLLLTNEPL